MTLKAELLRIKNPARHEVPYAGCDVRSVPEGKMGNLHFFYNDKVPAAQSNSIPMAQSLILHQKNRVAALPWERGGCIRIVKEISNLPLQFVDAPFGDNGIMYGRQGQSGIFGQAGQQVLQKSCVKVASQVNGASPAVPVPGNGGIFLPVGMVIDRQSLGSVRYEQFHPVMGSACAVGGNRKGTVFETYVDCIRKLIIGHAEDIRQAVGLVIGVDLKYRIRECRLKGGNQMAALFHIGFQGRNKRIGSAVERRGHQELVLAEQFGILHRQDVTFQIQFIESVIEPADDIVVTQIRMCLKPLQSRKRFIGEQERDICLLAKMFQVAAVSGEVSAYAMIYRECAELIFSGFTPIWVFVIIQIFQGGRR